VVVSETSSALLRPGLSSPDYPESRQADDRAILSIQPFALLVSDSCLCSRARVSKWREGGGGLEANTIGAYNTANGVGALEFNTTGSNNVALGYEAGDNLTTGSNNIDIGNPDVAGESGIIRIGTGVGVHVNAKGQLYTRTSSRRFKTDIHDISSISDKLMRLCPVTFRYKKAAPDGTHPVEYGLIAEEVAKVYPEMVLFDKADKPFAVDYDALTPMLLNELQKERRQISNQKRDRFDEIGVDGVKAIAAAAHRSGEINRPGRGVPEQSTDPPGRSDAALIWIASQENGKQEADQLGKAVGYTDAEQDLRV